MIFRNSVRTSIYLTDAMGWVVPREPKQPIRGKVIYYTCQNIAVCVIVTCSEGGKVHQESNESGSVL